MIFNKTFILVWTYDVIRWRRDPASVILQKKGLCFQSFKQE